MMFFKIIIISQLTFQIQKMQMQTLFSFQPQQHAIFMHAKPLLAVHESTDYFAFVSRNHQVILHNTKTSRSSTILTSQHGITAIAFTHQYLLVAEEYVHQLLIFSLRNQKLKKKLTGHRSQITCLAYCRNRGLIASLSHDQLIVFNENTLIRQKMIKCSTSTFADCSFSLAGNILAVLFTDGSLYLWNPNDYSHRQSGLPYKNLIVRIDNGSTIAVFNQERLFLADASKEVVVYQQIDRFWKGQIKDVHFMDGYVAVNTENCFYLADIQLQHQFLLKSISQFGQVDQFSVAEYQSVLLLVSNKLKRISLTKIVKNLMQLTKNSQKNPLTNKGLVCAGGYSNTQGCFVANGLQTLNNYQQVTKQVQKINNINYQPISTNFNKSKLISFIRKHHFLPDKHRPMAYRYLLKLPISPQQFRTFQHKGRHQCAALLDAKYPLDNKQLAQSMKDVLSLLSHYNSVFAEAEFIPTLIFPFVCLFGNDYFLCFQILYRLFTRPLSFLFKEFPVANSAYLQNVREIFAQVDPELLAHFSDKGLSFTKTCWTLLTTLFSASLGRQHFLAIIDALFVRIDQPEYIVFLLLGFLVYNRARILSINNDSSLTAFLDQEQTIHLGKYLSTVDKIAAGQSHNIRYPFQIINLQQKVYCPLAMVPQDALQMYENKRKILTEQLFKRQEEEKNRDDMLKQMEVLALAAKRQAQRQSIQKQAYNLHCQAQTQQTLTFKPRPQSDRIARIQHLIDELSSSIQNEQAKKDMLKNYLPSVTNLQLQSNQDLDRLEFKLAKLLTEIKPQQSNHWLKSQPLAVKKQGISDFNGFKAAVNTRLAGELWQLQGNRQANKMQRWQNNMLQSLNN